MCVCVCVSVCVCVRAAPHFTYGLDLRLGFGLLETFHITVFGLAAQGQRKRPNLKFSASMFRLATSRNV